MDSRSMTHLTTYGMQTAADNKYKQRLGGEGGSVEIGEQIS